MLSTLSLTSCVTPAICVPLRAVRLAGVLLKPSDADAAPIALAADGGDDEPCCAGTVVGDDAGMVVYEGPADDVRAKAKKYAAAAIATSATARKIIGSVFLLIMGSPILPPRRRSWQ